MTTATDCSNNSTTTEDQRVRAELQLETPVLRFCGVPAGYSQSHPIEVSAAGTAAVDLEVISPPLAPFSVVDMLQSGRTTSSDGRSNAKIWIRYDANSPMATDRGRITVGDRLTGQRWTIALDGRGSLASQYAELRP